MKFNLRVFARKIVGINDTPHKIAGGLGLGVFLGVLPFLGPVASLVLAALFRLNKVAAFMGSLLTNTWVGLLLLIPAVKIGSMVLGRDWQEVYGQIKNILKNFHFKDIFDVAVFQIVWPVVVGSAVIGLVFGIITYIVTFWVVVERRKRYADKRMNLEQEQK